MDKSAGRVVSEIGCIHNVDGLVLLFELKLRAIVKVTGTGSGTKSYLWIVANIEGNVLSIKKRQCNMKSLSSFFVIFKIQAITY